jgi:glycosyltransferase involved in cell wall biosynthesis
MNSQPLVSIVTPSYNQAQFLEETIQSVLSQDYAKIEYILVDGGSNDGSVEIVQKYQDRISWWVSEPDQGQTDAINKGFAHASGEILAWINSDDTYQPEAVSACVNYLLDHPEVGLVYGDANFIDGNGNVIGKFNAQQTSYQRLRRGGVYIPQQAAFWRAYLWRQVGPLDPSYYFAMDYDLWVRLARVTRIQYVQQHWANFRLHEDTKSMSEDDRCWPEMLRIHRRYGGSWLSLIYVRYYLRRLLAPLINWRRQQLYKNHSKG